MGVCCIERPLSDDCKLHYASKLVFHIGKQDFAGRSAGCEAVSTVLTRPGSVPEKKTVSTSIQRINVTTCVLPGLDPRGLYKKTCQDSVFWAEKDESLLVAVFDGHGDFGDKVATFCSSFTDSYFTDHYAEFPANPSTSLMQMLELCQLALEETEIDVSRTAVVVYIRENELFVGSLGDSRAVLGSIVSDYGGKAYEAIQISVDQKPNHHQEMARILEKGGIVSRMENDFGERIGPHRVWTKDHQAGLAMSRSLGDSICHDIGVIATPIVRRFTLSPRRDRFIVLGSDGIWSVLTRDVMKNEEVIQFLDDYSGKAANNADFHDIVTEKNTTLAHLLCEAARLHWVSIVESEDVMIDDISCVVLELQGRTAASAASSENSERKEEKLVSIATIDELYKLYPTCETELKAG